jgi:hypothetical protein
VSKIMRQSGRQEEKKKTNGSSGRCTND